MCFRDLRTLIHNNPPIVPTTSPMEKLLTISCNVSIILGVVPTVMNCRTAKLTIMTKTSLKAASMDTIAFISSDLTSLSTIGMAATLLTPPRMVPNNKDSSDDKCNTYEAI